MSNDTVCAKNFVHIKKSKVSTVDELVEKIRPDTGKEIEIKEIVSDEIKEILIDIGLSAFHLGFIFKKEVSKTIDSDIKKITFKNILTVLEKVLEKTKAPKFTIDLIEKDIDAAKNGKIKNPFNNQINLRKFKFTKPLFKYKEFHELPLQNKISILFSISVNKSKFLIQRLGSLNKLRNVNLRILSKETTKTDIDLNIKFEHKAQSVDVILEDGFIQNERSKRKFNSYKPFGEWILTINDDNYKQSLDDLFFIITYKAKSKYLHIGD